MDLEPVTTCDIVLPYEVSEMVDEWRAAAAAKLEIPLERVLDVRLIKHSIDARQLHIKVQLRLEVGIDTILPPNPERIPLRTTLAADARRVIIVGSGPGGLFAALRCLELGCRPIVLERGKGVSARRFDLAPILREGKIIEDSNYCFGEGGAGTFSDGKLYTRAKKRGPVHDIYEIFVAHGAPPRILVDSHPHIGSNLLPNVVKALRTTIIENGGEVHFGARVDRLLRRTGGSALAGVGTSDGKEYQGDAVILATGHSARDIYRLLNASSVRLEQKSFAVGVRIEHPQSYIDSVQYHIPIGTERPRILPAAAYSLATKIRDRGVHSFCMCPGGFIVPSATENDEVVVNGMSLSRRDSPFANSGLVVTVEPEDTKHLNAEFGVLAGIEFQKRLEQSASRAGGGFQKAPAQRVRDFIGGRTSADLPDSSYHPGLTSAALHKLLPPFIVGRLREGLLIFGRSMPGYLDDPAQLIGFETRTSSPVRIPRDARTLQHPDMAGLYPCGEGAGFAGGIVSAALDGRRCAEAACGG